MSTLKSQFLYQPGRKPSMSSTLKINWGIRYWKTSSGLAVEKMQIFVFKMWVSVEFMPLSEETCVMEVSTCKIIRLNLVHSSKSSTLYRLPLENHTGSSIVAQCSRLRSPQQTPDTSEERSVSRFKSLKNCWMMKLNVKLSSFTIEWDNFAVMRLSKSLSCSEKSTSRAFSDRRIE